MVHFPSFCIMAVVPLKLFLIFPDIFAANSA